MQPLRAVRLVVDRSIGGGQTHRVLMMSDCTEMMVVWSFIDSESERTLTVWLRRVGGYERFLGMAGGNKDRVVENNWDESSLAPRNSLVSRNKSQFRFAGGISGGAKTPAELAFFKELDGLVTVSKAVQKYAKQHCDLNTEMIPNHAWSYKDKDTGDWPRFRKNFAKQNVVMINPAWVDECWMG